MKTAQKQFFPNVVVQRCIVHLIRNSLKYVPTKDYKDFCAHLKKIYAALSLKAARVEFERFCQVWDKYPGAVAVWKRNFSHVEQLFDYPSAVRKIMYTTNAIEAINSGFRQVTKLRAFSSLKFFICVLLNFIASGVKVLLRIGLWFVTSFCLTNVWLNFLINLTINFQSFITYTKLLTLPKNSI